MAISKAETQVEWSTADTISVTSGSNQTSDEVTVNAADISGSLMVKADNAGTPVSGDYIDVKILYTLGDPDVDPDSADEFDDAAVSPVVARLDTNAVDPARVSNIPIDTNASGFKVYLESNAASNSITCSAQYRSTRSS